MAETDDTRRLEPFVRTHIRSAEELETLLLLFRSRSTWWTAEVAAGALHLDLAAARKALEHLCGAFLEVRIESDVRFRFATLNAEREALTESLERTYHQDRTALMRMIGRGGAARDFADAFRVKEEEP